MLLYVMRHGPAEDHAPTGRDFDRRLTAAGRALVLAMAEAFRAQRGAGPIRVLTSPRARARETAEIVHDTLSASREGPATGSAPAPIRAAEQPAVEIHNALDGEHPIPLELVSALAEGGADVLLVGHQPSVEELCRGLVRPEPLVLQSFRTATIIALEPTGARFRVASILDPSAVRP